MQTIISAQYNAEGCTAVKYHEKTFLEKIYHQKSTGYDFAQLYIDFLFSACSMLT